MSNGNSDPRCPECGGPIGQTAVYCMHCSADLTDRRESDDAGDDSEWGDAGSTSAGSSEATATGSIAGTITDAAGIGTEDGQLLDPDGVVDNTLTVVVGIAGGIVVGIVGTVVLTAATASGWGLLFGLGLWLGSTAYLVRQRTVQGAISKTAYAVALVLLLVPLVALSPVVETSGGLGERGASFVGILLFVLVPATIAAGIGWIAGRFVPDASDRS